jgi:phospholipid/cholesterol/gamma-HCH transport system substrate-binding protein
MIPRLVTPFRVGLVVLFGGLAFLYILSIIGRQKFDDDDTYAVWAVFRDASGLSAKSRITIAGIEVGIVQKIELTPDAQARITLRVGKDITLHDDARITKKSSSLLGDFMLEVYPGSLARPVLQPGAQVVNVVTPAGAEDVFAQMSDIAKDLQKMTRSLSELLASEDGVGSIKQIITSMNDLAGGLNRTLENAGGRLDRILGNVEGLSSDVRTLAGRQQPTVEEILRNLRTFSDQSNRLLATLNGIAGGSEGELKTSVASVRETLEELQKTLRGAQEAIASAKGAVDDTRTLISDVEKGQGSVGRLLRDDGLARSLEQTASDVQALLAPISELQTQVHIRQELHALPGALGNAQGKTLVQLKLNTKPDKFYGLEVVSDPRGTQKRERVTRTTAAGETMSEERTVTETDAFKISAFFGRRFGPAQVRLGLIESTGGLGGDLFLLNDSLRLTVDAFEFANPAKPRPRLRASAQLSLFDHFYLGAGVDDPLNPSVVEGSQIRSGLDVFATGGFFFTDDDLKSILAVTGLPGN